MVEKKMQHLEKTGPPRLMAFGRETMTDKLGLKKEPFYVKDPEQTAFLYCEIKPLLEKYSPADVCILCDVTGSVERHRDLMHEAINNIMREIKATLSSTPRFAVIGFRDKKDEHQYFKKDFTLDPEEAKNFIKGIECDGGGDDCEDLVGPMKEALNLSWRSDCLFVCIVLDAPAHGRSYHDTTDTDDYLDDDKEQLLEKLCAHYKKSRINLIILKTNDSVDKTVEAMRRHYDDPIVNKLSLINIQSSEGGLKDKFREAIKAEISHSFARSIYANFRKVKPALEAPQRAMWSADQNITIPIMVNIYGGAFKACPCHERKIFEYKLQTTKTVVNQRYVISTAPEAAGVFRTCHQLYAESRPDDRHVGKVPREVTTNPARLVGDIEGNVFATHFALTFNGLIGRNVIKILPLVIMEIVDDSYKQPMFNGSKCLVAQKYLEGEYVKYNNNYGWVNPDKDSPWNMFAQAFSHYTYEASLGTLMIVDIQGVVGDAGKGEMFVLTDPAIHSAVYKGRFGDTNHGRLGFMKFFETHVCNSYCKELKLTDPRALRKDDLLKMRMDHSASKGLAHIYGDFEKNFDAWLKKLKQFEPAEHKILPEIKEEKHEDDLASEYERDIVEENKPEF